MHHVFVCEADVATEFVVQSQDRHRSQSAPKPVDRRRCLRSVHKLIILRHGIEVTCPPNETYIVIVEARNRFTAPLGETKFTLVEFGGFVAELEAHFVDLVGLNIESRCQKLAVSRL